MILCIKKFFFGDQKLEIILQLIHISNYYFGWPDTKLELHKKEPTKLELQKNELTKLELHKLEPMQKRTLWFWA